jgi:phosphoesterase RecJ-like protein
MEQINRYVQAARTIAVVSHANPDGDTVGSALALCAVLRAIGKEVVSVCSDHLPPDLSALPYADIFAKGDIDGTYDLAFCVDIASPRMLGDAVRTLKKARHTVCIDHHLNHDLYTDRDYVRESAANTENMYDFLSRFYPQYIDKQVAECLYTGLVTDSGGFSYASVTEHTHWVASKLVAFGIDNERICYEQLRRQSLKFIRARSAAYHKALFAFDNRVAIVVFSSELMRQYGVTVEDMVGPLVEMMRAEEIVLAVSMVELQPERYKVSVRSKNPVSAAAVCNAFGGGGHFNAAGCQLNGAEGIVIDMLLEVIAKEL